MDVTLFTKSSPGKNKFDVLHVSSCKTLHSQAQAVSHKSRGTSPSFVNLKEIRFCLRKPDVEQGEENQHCLD